MVPSQTFMIYLPNIKVNLLSHNLTVWLASNSNTIQFDNQFLLFSQIIPVFVIPETKNLNLTSSSYAHQQSILPNQLVNKLVPTIKVSYTTDRSQVKVQYQNCTLPSRIVKRATLARISIFIFFHQFSTGIVIDILSFTYRSQISINFYFLYPSARNLSPMDTSVIVALFLMGLKPILYKYKLNALSTYSQTDKVPDRSNTAIQALLRELPYLEHQRQ